jgi:tubulin alpha
MDGRPDQDRVVAEGQDSGSYDTFFTESGSGKYVPRSIFVDLDPSVCGQASKTTWVCC